MGETKLMQDKVYYDQTNFLFQEKQQSANLLQRFSSEKHYLGQTHISSHNTIHPEVDLNLRLSLGEIYSGYPKERPLTRSSSIAGAVNLEKNSCDLYEKSLPKSFLSLARSCSLPVEVERSKRLVSMKELRIMRRVEAKKRVIEKQRNAEKASDKEKMEGPPSSPTKIPAWAAASAAKCPALNRAIEKIKEGFRKLEGLEGSGTKGRSVSESSSKPIKAEPAITFNTISNEKPIKLKHDETRPENPTKKAKLSNSCIQDGGMEVMNKMPSVTATGDGPNGRKIEGFLYKYLKGQVSIVCVCHGSFLSPEEFVKHAGGKDVTNPMKHINVCSTSFSYQE
ncbi:hypothetical protein DITRI_Ditri03aG0101800 [Diplodiscus trichospermus]